MDDIVGMGSEALVASGLIEVRIGDETLALHTRKIATARPWKIKMAQELGVELAKFNVPGTGGGDTMAALFAMQNVASEKILDLTVEYDLNNELGGRDYLEEHADDEEIYRLFRQILNRHFPFVRDVIGAMTELTRLLAETPVTSAMTALTTTIESAQAGSSNGHSPTGTSAPRTSKRVSTTRR